MTPYGNEHTNQIDSLNSSKHRPHMSATNRRSSRRVLRKIRRAQDKATIKHEVQNRD